MDITALSSALSSLKAAKDIAETMIGLRDTTSLQGKMIEFQSKILDAQNSALAAQDERSSLIERISKLEKEVADLKAWDAEKQRYQLTEIPGYNKVLAYTLKAQTESAEPAHWICATCYTRCKKSILQPETRMPGADKYLVCNECGSELCVHGSWRKDHQKIRR